MTIHVDADACPVKQEIERAAQKYHIPVVYYFDVAHVIQSDIATLRQVDQGKDVADAELYKACRTGDIVVTQDYGLAALALPKKAYVIHPNGFLFTENNIEQLLFERFLNQESRRRGKRPSPIPKRAKDKNEKFYQCLVEVIERVHPM